MGHPTPKAYETHGAPTATATIQARRARIGAQEALPGSSKSDLVADLMTRGDPAARPNAQGQPNAQAPNAQAPNAQAPNAQEKMSEFRLTYYTRVVGLDETIKTTYYNYCPRRPRCPAISTQRPRQTRRPSQPTPRENRHPGVTLPLHTRSRKGRSACIRS